MGFLDNKGLKKVVNWVKEYVKNNSVDEKAIQNKQDVWKMFYGPYIAPYTISFVYINTTVVFDSYGSITPDASKEYKVRGSGLALHSATFPSTFDMPWPNNEIPKWEDNHEYEIYIAGGRVVSVDDITPPVEEVSYIIEANEDCTFKLAGTANWVYKLNNDDWIMESTSVNLVLPVGENIICIRNNSGGDLEDLYNLKITNYNYLKVDCSKMKSNNLHEVLRDLKVDEIIYPQACIGNVESPVYKFEAPEVDLRCLKYNTLHYPKFDFKTDNFIGINFGRISFDDCYILFGKNISNINANKILRELYETEYFTDFNLENLKTIGTISDSVNVVSSIIGSTCKFINCFLGHTYVTNKTYQIRSEEFIISEPARSVILESIEPISPIGFIENLQELYEFDIANTTNTKYYIYYVEGDVNYVTTSGSAAIEFIKVNSVEEVPFQYAPRDWDDVKNYDDEGNVIE